MDEVVDLPRLDLRVATVLEAQSHPNADRLMVLQIDPGSERRQIVAGIVGHYAPDDLVGLRIVVVANLRPARLRGEMSEGMLLAAEDEEGRLGLLTAPDAEPGRRLSTEVDPPPASEVSFEAFKRHELRAGPDGVTQNGRALQGARLVMDRGVYGRLR
jgi:methionine--tRNA ligase beta chain